MNAAISSEKINPPLAWPIWARDAATLGSTVLLVLAAPISDAASICRASLITASLLSFALVWRMYLPDPASLCIAISGYLLLATQVSLSQTPAGLTLGPINAVLGAVGGSLCILGLVRLVNSRRDADEAASAESSDPASSAPASSDAQAGPFAVRPVSEGDLPALAPLGSFLCYAAQTFEQTAAALDRSVPDRAQGRERVRRTLYQLQNLALLAKSETVPPGVAPLNGTIQKIMDEELCLARLSRAKVSIELDPSSPLVGVPAPFLELLVWNLLENALRAATDRPGIGGRLSIRTRAERGRVALVVEDDGAGLPPGSTEQLFVPLRAPSCGHLHLGLWASRRIAEGSGGDIQVSGRNCGGTQVVVQLPTFAAGPMPVG